jgi:hypothetical protein
MDAVILLLRGARGLYIPRDFAQGYDLDAWHVPTEAQKHLADPYQDWYWDAWNEVQHVAYLEYGEDRYTLYQDWNLWAICYEKMTPEERENFGFDPE